MTKQPDTTQHYFHQAIIQDLDVHVYWKDTQGKLLGCNLAQAKFLGFNSIEAVIGKTDFDLMPKNAATKIFELDQKIILTGAPNTEEEVFLKDDGTKVYFLSRKQAVFDENNNIIGLLGISSDITAEREAKNFKKQQEISEEKLKNTKLLAASIAHEMRTPLATISVNIDNLTHLLPKVTDELRAHQSLSKPELKMLQNSAHSLQQVVQETNHFIDMLLGTINHVEPQNIELLSVKSIVLDTLASHPKTDVAIHFLDGEDFIFEGDQTLCKHILFNLLKNALHHVKAAGKGEVTIWTELQPNGNILHFKDTGTGIAADALPKIFDKFFTQTRHGTGIGLAFCKTAMESMGGQIMCESQEHKYAHFQLIFPKQ